MLCRSFNYACFRQVKHGEERFWWQDRELYILSYHRSDRLWRHYLVHHPVTGVQIGWVRWWYSRERNISYLEQEEENDEGI
jgi:hypothetical protein